MTTPKFIRCANLPEKQGIEQSWESVAASEILSYTRVFGKGWRHVWLELQMRNGEKRYATWDHVKKLRDPSQTVADNTGKRLIVFGTGTDESDIIAVIVDVVAWQIENFEAKPVVAVPPSCAIDDVDYLAYSGEYATIEKSGMVRCPKHLLYGRGVGRSPEIEKLFPSMGRLFAEVELVSWARRKGYAKKLLPILADGEGFNLDEMEKEADAYPLAA